MTANTTMLKKETKEVKGMSEQMIMQMQAIAENKIEMHNMPMTPKQGQSRDLQNTAVSPEPQKIAAHFGVVQE
eukprot:11820153-Ditylum_brightwellii.AAC.1